MLGEDDDLAGIERDAAAAVKEAEEVFEGGEAVDLGAAGERLAGLAADFLKEVRLIVGDDAAIAEDGGAFLAVVFDAGGVALLKA